MRREAKRKTKQSQEAKHGAPEDKKPKVQPRAKRAKTSKPQSEPEYFEDKRNLVSLINTSPLLFSFLFQFEPQKEKGHKNDEKKKIKERKEEKGRKKEHQKKKK